MSESEHLKLAAGLRRELERIPQERRRNVYISLSLIALVILLNCLRPMPQKLHPALLIIAPFILAIIYFSLRTIPLDQAVANRIRQLALNNLVQRGLLDEVLRAQSVAELVPHDSDKDRKHLEIINASYGNNGLLQSAEQRLHFLTSEYEMLCYLRRWHYEGVPERPVLHPANSGWRRQSNRSAPQDSDWSSPRREGAEHQILLEVLIDILEGCVGDVEVSGDE